MRAIHREQFHLRHRHFHQGSGSATGNYSKSGIAIDNEATSPLSPASIATTFGSATGAYSNAGIDINNTGDIIPDAARQHRH